MARASSLFLARALALALPLPLPLACSHEQRASALRVLPGSSSFHVHLGRSPSQPRPSRSASLPFWSRLTAQAEKHFCSSSIMAPTCRESKEVNPGLNEIPDEATKGYYMQQTMLRVKDPQVSLDFYTRILGMTLLKRLDFEAGKFSLYFLGYEAPTARPEDPVERVRWTFQKLATIELTHNWGTESDPEFKGYHNGNKDPRGFGHIGIAVDDTYKACERFEKLGVEFVKKPDEGIMKGLAFIKDPDEYWIEIFDVKRMGDLNT